MQVLCARTHWWSLRVQGRGACLQLPAVGLAFMRLITLNFALCCSVTCEYTALYQSQMLTLSFSPTHKSLLPNIDPQRFPDARCHSDERLQPKAK